MAPALRPASPASDGATPLTPGWLEWQAEHWVSKTAAPAFGSEAANTAELLIAISAAMTASAAMVQKNYSHMDKAHDYLAERLRKTEGRGGGTSD